MKLLMCMAAALVFACVATGQSKDPEQPPKASKPTEETEREGTITALRDLLGGHHIGIQAMLSSSRQAFEIADAAIARAKIEADPDKATDFLNLARQAGVIGAALSAQVRKAQESLDAIEEAKVDLKRRVIDCAAALKIAVEHSVTIRSYIEDQSMPKELASIGDRVGRPFKPLIEVKR